MSNEDINKPEESIMDKIGNVIDWVKKANLKPWLKHATKDIDFAKDMKSTDDVGLS